ncbi:insulinase family protein [bacterium]|nr:insulinase family protein [bacterium]
MKTKLTTAVLLLLLNLVPPLWAINDSLTTREFIVKDFKVILKPKPASEIVSVQLYWRGGSLNLTESTQGIEPFIFNSAQLDAKKFVKKNWNKLLQGTGAELGTVAARNFTLLSLRCLQKNFDELWELYSDYIMKSVFRDERVEVSREQMLTQIRRRKDNPDTYLRDLAETQFYEGHPYAQNPAGTVDSIRRISMKEMKSYLKDNLRKQRLLLTVVGNVAEGDLRKKVYETFAKLKDDKVVIEPPPRVEHMKSRVKVVERDLPTNYMLALFAAPSLNDPDYYPTAIAVDILKWRLFEEIRTKRNLSYSPDAFLATHFSNYGGIYATTDYPDSTVKVMISEMNKLRQEPVPEKHVLDRINMYITRYYLDHESGQAQGRLLASLELSGAGWQESEKIVQKIRSVTASEVQRVANQYFKNLQFVYLGNPELIDEAAFTTL